MVLQTDEQLRIWWHEPRKGRARTRLGIRSTASAIMNKNTVEIEREYKGVLWVPALLLNTYGIIRYSSNPTPPSNHLFPLMCPTVKFMLAQP